MTPSVVSPYVFYVLAPNFWHSWLSSAQLAVSIADSLRLTARTRVIRLTALSYVKLIGKDKLNVVITL